ncbi:putative Dol-P-Glc:Glc(2)Man(9)GlcNAc(2)-PP-Dol alpha-1,2-glucosyltransferase [Physella acuta]|uniref:putative Dol-P-Glc:Glc(2)Man(9)GlcNAc(2)-PP-Dol alpha-1,2-glucosyltransferase n=1 Tax=Physella acuta TaxID=109671 RepID=UPI0027DCBFFD|nr:putative Dol-P-Glc:Glc(2)Man(9)GlcNAc(2)-PP-Dol alpha-1,2-glucosyltransferase [Physella acuta]
MQQYVFALSFVLLATVIIFRYVQTAQEDPYMDEIFHVPQAMQYCSGNFSSWDPMITTLPGLYLSSFVMLLPFAMGQGFNLSDICTTYNLRACNIAFCVGNFILLYFLSKKLHLSTKIQEKAELRIVFNSLVLGFLPFLYFFSWLYYTDPGATFFTLLTYLFCLKKQYGFSATAGVIAIVFRQTNVIWIVFCLCIAEFEIIESDMQCNVHLEKNQDFDYLKAILKTYCLNMYSLITLVKKSFVKLWMYLFVLCGFIIFVILNDGVVVGDRTHHKASFNFPQVFYFSLITSALSVLHITNLTILNSFFKTICKNPFRLLLFVLVSSLLISKFTYEHKYLLSDNRHYTFYVWSKFFRRFPVVRYALIPAYLYCIYSFYKLTIERGILWHLATLFCITACLVPQMLLEFRYFIIPFYILRLNIKLPSLSTLVIELLFNICVNVFTVYMFVKRPFYWPDDPNPQRFMW